jgi:hypothetical protein
MEERTAGDPHSRERRRRMDRCEDRGSNERTGGHPEERERPDHTEGAGPQVALEQMGCGRGADRDEDPAADRLDDAGGDEGIERRGRAGEGGADREEGEAGENEATGPHVAGASASSIVI